jgi:hypothetical protein
MDIEQIFAGFFKNVIDYNPDVALSPAPPRPRGWMEEYRAGAFQTIHNFALKTDIPWTQLSGRVYELSRSQLSVVLAVYSDDTILWLDDHSGDSDFEGFARRERLATWLPQQMNELLTLLIETKFNYLGQPQLVQSASEIPGFKVGPGKAPATLLEEKKHFDSVAKQIQPPECVSEQQGVRLSFCLWSRILGRVLAVDCLFGSDGSFTFEAAQLAEHIGDFFVPR